MVVFLVWLVILFLAYKFITKHRESLLKIYFKIVAAFKDNEGNKSKNNSEVNDTHYESGSEIPQNVRKDILNKRYLFMFEDSQSPVNDDKQRSTSKEDSKSDASSKKDDDYPVRKIQANTVFADKNGEIHSLLDLASAPVNQSSESKRKISYQRTNKPSFESREAYKQHKQHIEKKPKQTQQKDNAKAEDSNQTVDWVSQVKARLKSRA